MLDAFAHQAFGTPASHAANAKDDDALLSDSFHRIGTKQQLCPVE